MGTDKLSVCFGDVEALGASLSRHPFIEPIRQHIEPALQWESQGRTRRIWVDNPDCELLGLIELIDNNPLVCADEFSVPSAGGTLALLGLGPLLRNGMLLEAPTVMLSFAESEESVSNAVMRAGWDQGVTVVSQDQDFGSVLAATCMAVIQSPKDPEEIAEVFETIYGHSFFVREETLESWRIETVSNTPMASYRLRITLDEPTSLLSIMVMADRDGKCGAGQIVHALNIMCGFEESLGIA